jgi:hypothetical protein
MHEQLQDGPLYGFADWPNEQVPRRAAGVYTIWRESQLVYVGMSGRGAQREDFVAVPGETTGQAKGLWTRLKSHASGRRSGDQFNVQVCDRFVVPSLTAAQQRQVGAGELRLDELTRQFIHDHLAYRFVVVADGAQALAIERDMRAGSLPAGQPFLNPPR